MPPVGFEPEILALHYYGRVLTYTTIYTLV